MKTNDKKELQAKTVTELKKLLEDAKKVLLELKLSHEQNKLKDTRSIFMTRKRIAIIETIMRAKESAVTKVVADKGGKE